MVFSTKSAVLTITAGLLLASSAIAQTDQNQYEALTRPSTSGKAQSFNQDATPPVQVLATHIDTSIFYEDFGDGISDWTITRENPTDVDVWTYQTNDTLTKNTLIKSYPVFASPTVDNGFLFFNYDAYVTDSGRVSPGSPPYPRLTQSIKSPYFSTKSAGPGAKLALNWYQVIRVLNIRNSNIRFVKAGDPSPSASIEANPGLVVQNYGANNRFVRIPDAYVDADSVQVIFTYDGDFYLWAIDDIFVSALPGTDLKIDPDFIAMAPSYSTPQSQADGQFMYFVTDVTNAGALDVDTKLAITISTVVAAPGTGTVVYTDTLSYGVLVADSLYQNEPFLQRAPLPTTPGQYRGTYRVIPNNGQVDADPSNNTGSFTFFIDGSEFPYYAKGPVLRSSTRPGNAPSQSKYMVGNIYYLPNLAGNEVVIDSVEYGYLVDGLEDNGDASIVELITYGYRGDLNDDGQPGFGSATSDTTEFVRLGSRLILIEPGTPTGYYDFLLPPDEFDGAVKIPRDQGFIGFALALDYSEATAPADVPDEFWAGVDTRITYGAFNLAIDSLVTRGIIAQPEAYTSFAQLRGLDPGSQNLYNFGTSGFYLNAVMMISPVGVTELPESAFKVFPNPANTQVTFDFDFGNQAGDIRFDVVNAVGQRVRTFNRSGLTSGQFTLPISDLNVGMYYITATTSDNRGATRKVLIQR